MHHVDAKENRREILIQSDLPYLLDENSNLFLNDLDFLETPKLVHFNYLSYSTDQFHRSIKRKVPTEKFECSREQNKTNKTKPGAPFQHQKFKQNSNWTPPGPPILEYMCFLNENKIQNQPKSNHKRANLRKAEFEALKSLKSNNDIIIK